MRTKAAICLMVLSMVLFSLVGCQPAGTNEKFVSADVSGSTSSNGRYYETSLTGAAPALDAVDSSAAAVREIEEADIVKKIDNYLYVMTTDRGLRIIDVADWAKPVIKGTFAFTGSPIEMYVNNNVASIVVCNYSTCRLDSAAQPVKQSASKIYLVDVSNPAAPAAVDTFDIDGYVSETRRVGDVIYLAGTLTYDYWNMQSQSATAFVSSVYVANPANVHLVAEQEFAGQGDLISASQSAIFVAGVDWNTGKSKIQYVDISDPAGKIVLRDSCQVSGQILNRFAIDAHNNVLRVVSDSRWWGMPVPMPMGEPMALKEEDVSGVRLSTFNINNPDNITQLGSLGIIQDETLRAVRFDGLKAYVVTFEQIDPLWVINLSNPAAPVISGELEAPGFSTYIEVDGDRLVAVGVNGDGRASVMLYDVSNPASPKELDRAALGAEYSSSEAVYDDKAFKVIPEAKLILVPFDSWDNNTYAHKLQMLDYSGDNLTELAAVDHRGTILRSGVDLAQNVLWLTSQRALETFNIADKKAPVSLADLSLAENVLAVKFVGTHEMRMVVQNDNYDNPAVELQVIADPLVTKTFNIFNAKLSIISDKLAVLTGANKDGKIRVITIKIDELPKLTIAADKTLDATLAGWLGFFKPGSGWGVEIMGQDMARTSPAFAGFAMPSIMPLWQTDQDNPMVLANGGLAFITQTNPDYYKFYTEKQITLVSLANPAAPAITATVKINDADYDMIMQIGSQGNTVYSTVENILAMPPLQTIVNGWQKPLAAYKLKLINCTDLKNPQSQTPVNVPGITVGLRDDIIFTVDPQWTDNDITNQFCTVRITDGKASLVDSVDLPKGQPGKVFFTAKSAVFCMDSYYPIYAGDVAVGSPTTTTVSPDSNDCYLGSFKLLSINISDPQNLKIASNKEYSGTGQLAGIAENYIIGQTNYTGQGLIWKMADDQTVSLNKVVDLPSAITDIAIGNGKINLACGPGGIILINK